MKHWNPRPQSDNQLLLSEFLRMSQTGTAPFVEEADFLNLLEFCHAQGQTHTAFAVLQDAVAQHPFSVELYLYKAETHLKLGQLGKTLVTVQKVKALDPAEKRADLLEVKVLMAQKQYDLALETVVELREKTNLSCVKSACWIIESEIFSVQKNIKAEYRALRAALLADPDNTEGYEKILLATEKTLRFADSIQFYNTLLDRDAYNAFAWYCLGVAHEALEEFEQALEAFEFAFAIDESFRAAYLEAGEIHLSRADFFTAQTVYEAALFKTEKDALLLHKLGVCYLKQGFIEAGLELFEQSVRHDEAKETVIDNLFRLGECHAALGKHLKAIDFYQRAIAQDGRREEFYTALGDAYFHTEQFSKAIVCYRRAAWIAPEEVAHWVRFAEFWLGVGQNRKALRVLDDAQNYTFGAEIEYCRAACLYAMGRRTEALDSLSDALQIDASKHTSLRRWQPEWLDSADCKAMINYYESEV